MKKSIITLSTAILLSTNVSAQELSTNTSLVVDDFKNKISLIVQQWLKDQLINILLEDNDVTNNTNNNLWISEINEINFNVILEELWKVDKKISFLHKKYTEMLWKEIKWKYPFQIEKSIIIKLFKDINISDYSNGEIIELINNTVYIAQSIRNNRFNLNTYNNILYYWKHIVNNDNIDKYSTYNGEEIVLDKVEDIKDIFKLLLDKKVLTYENIIQLLEKSIIDIEKEILKSAELSSIDKENNKLNIELSKRKEEIKIQFQFMITDIVASIQLLKNSNIWNKEDIIKKAQIFIDYSNNPEQHYLNNYLTPDLELQIKGIINYISVE